SGTSCPNLSFTVGTYVFRVNSSTQYSGGTCTNIQAGSRINFSGTQETSTPPVFTIALLSFVTGSTPPPTPTPTPTPSTPVNTAGTITSIGSGMCPELQFFFGSYAINVSYATQYTGGSCADLKTGATVAFSGSRRDGENFVRVASLTFTHDSTPTTPTTPGSGDVSVSSLVAGKLCPNLSCMVGLYAMTDSTTTTFDTLA